MSQDMCVNCGAVLVWTEKPLPLIVLVVGGYYAFCSTCKNEKCVALEEGVPFVTPMSIVESAEEGIAV